MTGHSEPRPQHNHTTISATCNIVRTVSACAGLKLELLGQMSGGRPWYSEVYLADDGHEYRHVQMSHKNDTSRLLTRDEWQTLGIVLAAGWEHYTWHKPESHILLFRRPLPALRKRREAGTQTEEVTQGEGMAPPSAGMAAPIAGVAAPSGGLAPSPGGVAPPSGGVASPSGGVAPPSGGVAPPSGGVAPLSGGVAPLSGGLTPEAGARPRIREAAQLPLEEALARVGLCPKLLPGGCPEVTESALAYEALTARMEEAHVESALRVAALARAVVILRGIRGVGGVAWARALLLQDEFQQHLMAATERLCCCHYGSSCSRAVCEVATTALVPLLPWATVLMHRGARACRYGSFREIGIMILRVSWVELCWGAARGELDRLSWTVGVATAAHMVAVVGQRHLG